MGEGIENKLKKLKILKKTQGGEGKRINSINSKYSINSGGRRKKNKLNKLKILYKLRGGEEKRINSINSKYLINSGGRRKKN